MAKKIIKSKSIQRSVGESYSVTVTGSYDSVVSPEGATVTVDETFPSLITNLTVTGDSYTAIESNALHVTGNRVLGVLTVTSTKFSIGNPRYRVYSITITGEYTNTSIPLFYDSGDEEDSTKSTIEIPYLVQNDIFIDYKSGTDSSAEGYFNIGFYLNLITSIETSKNITQSSDVFDYCVSNFTDLISASGYIIKDGSCYPIVAVKINYSSPIAWTIEYVRISGTGVTSEAVRIIGLSGQNTTFTKQVRDLEKLWP